MLTIDVCGISEQDSLWGVSWDAEWNPQRTEEPGALQGPVGTRRDTTATCKTGLGTGSSGRHCCCGISQWLLCVLRVDTHTHTHCVEIQTQSSSASVSLVSITF